MNTAELNPIVSQAAINAEFNQITAAMPDLNNAAFSFEMPNVALSEKGFKSAGDLGSAAVNSEVRFDGAVDAMKSNEEMAAIARKSEMLYNDVAGVNAARANYEMSRVGKAEDDEDER